MGRDKARLPVDGVPMAVRVVRALEAAGADAVVCVGGDRDGLDALGLRVTADDHPGEGPLGAIVTALRWCSSPVLVVSPCDLITPQADSFRRLVAALADVDADVAVPIVDGAWRALPSALRRSCLADLAAAFDAGERAVHHAVEALERVALDAGALADADTPEELEAHR
jgi:molybdopterin-guanine dinucleotide biosynthesis protein A